MKRAEQSVSDLISPVQRERIVRYLLDQLDQAERAKLEEEMERTPAFFDAIASVEDELIFSYLRDDLDFALTRRFSEVYLGDTARRARVEKARALRNAVNQISREHRKQVHTPWRLRWAIISALSAVLLSVGLGFLWQSSRRSTAHLPPAPAASFSLYPGLTRSGGGLEIAIPHGARNIEFLLQVPAVQADKTYHAVLGTPERPGIWKGEVLRRDSALVLTVPADALPPGDYTLALQTGTEDVATYYFRVAKAK